MSTRGEKRLENKTENIFYKCDLEFHFASISGLGGSILSKKVENRCTLV
jgi:hypothetical protein